MGLDQQPQQAERRNRTRRASQPEANPRRCGRRRRPERQPAAHQLTDVELRAPPADRTGAGPTTKTLPAETRARLEESIKASGQEILARRARSRERPAARSGRPGAAAGPIGAGNAPGGRTARPRQPQPGQPTPVIANRASDANAERQATALSPTARAGQRVVQRRAERSPQPLSRRAPAGNLSPDNQRRPAPAPEE